MSNIWREGELVFEFGDDVIVQKLDEQGVPIPAGMCLVDLAVKEERRTLLIEIKDPSQAIVPADQRSRFSQSMSGDSYIQEKLVPKARDSYTFLHLMQEDNNEFFFVVVFGLECFKPNDRALLLGFKDRLLRRLRHEGKNPWKRLYIVDCVTLTVEDFPKLFPEYTLTRQVGP